MMPVLAPVVTDIPGQGTTFQLALANIPVKGCVLQLLWQRCEF